MIWQAYRILPRIFNEIRKELRYAIPSRRPRRILFDHIPKCAGSTLGKYLQAHYPRRKTFATDGRRPAESIARFLDLPESRRHAFALIKGHQAGLLIDAVHPETLKITVLREPVDRIVSHYYFAKRTQSHYLYDKIHRKKMSLKDYVEAEFSHELKNHYTLHFSGLSLKQAEADPDASIALALEKIRRFDLVGFQDDLSGFIESLRREGGLSRPIPKRKTNVTQNRKNVQDLDDATREMIVASNALDLQLFQKVQNAT